MLPIWIEKGSKLKFLPQPFQLPLPRMCAVTYNNAVCVNNQNPLKPHNLALGTFSLILKTCSDLLLISGWQSIPNELSVKTCFWRILAK